MTTQFLTRDLTTGRLTEILGLSNSDAFGRQRVSTPHTVFDLTHIYDKQPLYVEELLSSGGTSTHLPNESSVRMAVTTTIGSEVVRQTRRYFRYQPGKSMYVLLSGILVDNASNSGIRSRIGLFDDHTDKTVDVGGNGIYFQFSGGELKICKRSYITGSQVDTVLNPIDWSEGDKLDGNGPSGVTFDPAAIQLFWIDLEWLGAGTVRCGIFIDGKSIHLHSFHAANVMSSVYMTRASLPIRYEITQITGTSAASMKQTCSTVLSEGGHDKVGRKFSRAMTTTRTVLTTLIPIMSIRLRNAYNRALILPEEMELLTTTPQNLIYQVIYGGTLIGATFNAHDTNNSAVEFDIAATAITGGRVISTGFVGSLNRQIQSAVDVLDTPNVSIAGVPEIVTLAVQATGIAATAASMSWREEL